MKKIRRSQLSKSSRLSEKAMEYYLKYGKDRELEKFFRFRSPGGSQKSSSTTTTSTSSSDDWARVGNLKYLFHEKESSEEHKATITHDMPTVGSSLDKNEHFIPIEIESGDKAIPVDKEPMQSTQSPKTPVRKKDIDTKQTQTPESTAKSHRRLEWDSLGDVGYKKSKSTSNVSIVERMLLREFYEVTTNAPKNTNSSESDIRQLEQEIAELGTLRKHFSKTAPATEESNYGTPPLASSTCVEGVENLKFKSKIHPKVHTVGTNTSTLQQKYEKSAQTSLRKPEMTSQEVQVTLTPPGISPLLGSSAEPSSFEYRSRLSTNSSEPKSIQSSTTQTGRPKAGEVHFKANQQRTALGTKNENFAETDVCERLKNLFISWNKAMDENKENASSSSSCSNGSNTPQIDLGIQLICGIMKAKNIDQKQKKRLVRNIVKRITKIANSCELDAIVSRTATLIESTTDSSMEKSEAAQIIQKATQKVETPLTKSNTSKDAEQKNMYTNQKTTKSHPTKPGTKPNIQQEPPSPKAHKPKTKSKKVDNTTQNKDLGNHSTNVTGSTIDPYSTISSKNSIDIPQSSKDLSASTAQAINAQSKSKALERLPKSPTKITKKASSSSSSNDYAMEPHLPALDISLCVSDTVSGRKLVSAFITQPEVKDSRSTTKSETTTSSSSTNVPTQKPETKPALEHKFDAANITNAAMQEWLEPMTQSEIEYENKKRSLKTHSKGQKQFNSARSGKYVELNWIDCEIERLQCLKQNLLKSRTGIPAGAENYSQPNQEHKLPAETSEKLYDTVYSDHAEGGVRTASPVTKGVSAKSEQKALVTEKRTSKDIPKPKKPGDLHLKQKDTQQQKFVPTQRSKIDTPTDTIGSESVGSFVRQRKQEFLDHYKSQKLNHYNQMKHKYNERPSTSQAAVAASQYLSDGCGHYSVPIPIQFQQPTSYYTYPPMQQYRDHCYYAQTLAPVEAATKRVSSDMPTKTPRATSSELSVPMGSYNTNSTSTTTHQYDIATTTGAVTDKANIGSQTGRSLMHSRPIYETRCISPYHIRTMVPCSNYVACTCRDISRSACVQARPKGIAYSLQFATKSTKAKATEDAEGSSTSSEEYKTLDKGAAPSLQAALKRGNPIFLAHAKKRKSILNRIQKLRQERERELREIADDNTSLNSLDRKLGHLPPPVTEKLRIFPTKQMKAMTNKRVATLPEVLASQERERDQRYKRSNRLLREIYNRRLRARVRGGKLSLNHSLTLI